MIVNCNTEVDIDLDENEKETIAKAYEILKDIRHECFIQDDVSDAYWMAESVTSSIYDLMRLAGVELER